MDSPEAIAIATKTPKLMSLTETRQSSDECWTSLSGLGIIMVIAKAWTGQVTFYHNLARIQGDPLSNNPTDGFYAMAGLEAEEHPVAMISDCFDTRTVRQVTLESLLTCQNTDQIKSVIPTNTDIIVRTVEVVPPAILRAWMEPDDEDRTPTQYLLALVFFIEQHDRKVSEDQKLQNHLLRLMNWLFYCITDENWASTTTDTAVEPRVMRWAKTLHLMNITPKWTQVTPT